MLKNPQWYGVETKPTPRVTAIYHERQLVTTTRCMLPRTLPSLPSSPQAGWPPNLLLAHDALGDIYQHALRVLDQDQMDPIQVKFHLAAIEGDAVPLLLAVEHDYTSTDLEEWSVTAATQFKNLHLALSHYCENLQTQ